MMLQVHADGRLSWSGAGADLVSQTRGTIELPADMVEQYAT
jgi:hypothetical protein